MVKNQTSIILKCRGLWPFTKLGPKAIKSLFIGYAKFWILIDCYILVQCYSGIARCWVYRR